MAVQIEEKLSTREKKTFCTDYTPSLASGVTVSSAVAVHTPPSGSALTPTASVVGPLVYVTLGKVTVVGTHTLSVVATLSDGEEIEVLYSIAVGW
jgi:hypothetical protein